MRFIIKRETTGKVGRLEYDHQITILQHFPSFDEALGVLQSKRNAFIGFNSRARIVGPDSDYYVILQSKELDCITRYWIEKENSRPELPWWMEY